MGAQSSSGLANDAHLKGRTICLLCAEGNPLEADGVTQRCHRVYAAKRLAFLLGGVRIEHLLVPRGGTSAG